MALKVETDHSRFKEIVKGKVKKNLRKYITKGELIGRKGKDIVSIPVPQVDIPRFTYGSKKVGGTGQGEGEPGTPLAPGEREHGPGDAGQYPGEHILEVDISLEELAQMLGEELELPNIEPKGKKTIISEKEKYTDIRRTGPESLRHFKRTYKEALKRQIIANSYDPENPVIIPIRRDKRYRSWRVTTKEESNAVIIYQMDVSGSMEEEQKEIVRIECFWIDTWLKYQYREIKARYIIHDAQAMEVDEHTFYHTRQSGGTMISSAYKKALEIINSDYDPNEWNIYLFHFSDGDNWSGGDTARCIELLKRNLIPISNLFCYGQVTSVFGSGQFKYDLDEWFADEEKLITSEIDDYDAIYDSIKDFLGKGK